MKKSEVNKQQKENERQTMIMPSYWTPTGKFVVEHEVFFPEQTIEDLVRMLNEFHTICDERGYGKKLADLHQQIEKQESELRTRRSRDRDILILRRENTQLDTEVERLKKELKIMHIRWDTMNMECDGPDSLEFFTEHELKKLQTKFNIF